MMWAPLFTWARAISEASSNFSAAISSLNFFEPMTLVRSPTITGRTSSISRVVDARERERPDRADVRAGRRPCDGLGQRLDVAGVGAAAAADHVEPAVLGEAASARASISGRLEVAAVLVGQARRWARRTPGSGDIPAGCGRDRS